MKRFNSLAILALLLQLFGADTALSCSMYKVTANGKTLTGNNYDAYFLTTRIWFETGTAGQYGAVFSGARYDGPNGFAPQAGMNEYGLAFSLAAVPMREIAAEPGKKQITSRTAFLKAILHTCKTVEEVRDYFSKYDRGALIGDLFLYVDKTGKALIIEPDKMRIESGPTCVLSNFCPSITKEEDALKMAKYRNGIAFLKKGMDTSIAFCTALSDTMHVCRKKIGDGTLLTCIRDLNEGMVYYYFYHDYKHPVKFNLKEELKKGDHMYEAVKLFPPNAEFERLRNYHTPQNSPLITLFLLGSAVLFFCSSLFFLISFFRKRKTATYSAVKLLPTALGIILTPYVLILARNEHIFYFPAPYKDPGNAFISALSYAPFLLLLLIIPLFVVNIKLFREKTWPVFTKCVFALNKLVYITLIVLFAYWGLFNVFS